MKDEKRGAEFTIGTLIWIVLGVIVLVVLIVGFTGGWGNLWSNIAAFFGGGANVDAIKQACATACTTGAKDAWCNRQRTVKYTKTDGKLGTLKDKTCNALASSAVVEVEVAPCEQITCPPANQPAQQKQAGSKQASE